MRIALLCMITAAVIAPASHAAVFRVGLDGASPYHNVQAAIDAASSGDTVVVAPGLGYPSFSVTKRLLITGAGTHTLADEFTRIDGSVIITEPADSTELRSLWIRANLNSNADSAAGALKIRSGVQGIIIRRCFIENVAGGATGIAACLSVGSWATVTCTQSIFQSSGSANSRGITGEIKEHWRIDMNSCAVVGSWYGVSAWSSASCDMTMKHCIFTGSINHSPFYTTSLGGTIVNGVFLYRSSPSWGPGTLMYNYCAFSGDPPAGTGNIIADSSAFIALDFGTARLSDYHLSPTSVCRDAGNSAGPPDLDDSTADMGVFGGQHPYIEGGIPDFPFAVNLEIPANVPRDGVLRIWSRGRIGPGY